MWVSRIIRRLNRPCSLLNTEKLFEHVSVMGLGAVYCSICMRQLKGWMKTTMEDNIKEMENLMSFL